MPFALGTSATRLSVFALQFTDRSFDYRTIGEGRVAEQEMKRNAA